MEIAKYKFLCTYQQLATVCEPLEELLIEQG